MLLTGRVQQREAHEELLECEEAVAVGVNHLVRGLQLPLGVRVFAAGAEYVQASSMIRLADCYRTTGSVEPASVSEPATFG